MDGDLPALTSILDAGAAIDDCGTSYTPLMFAARYGQTDAARLLIERGADVQHRDNNGDRPMLWAADKGAADIISMFLDAGDTADSPLDPYGHSPLYKAALWGHAPAVEVLLAAAANPNSIAQSDETPLHAATRYGFAEVVTLLLKAGANPNSAESVFGQTPVHQAASDDTAEALAALLDGGGDAERPDRDGRTPLFLAAETGRPETASLLLDRGVDADTTDSRGLSAFAMAAGVSKKPKRRDDYRDVLVALANHVSKLDEAFTEAIWGGYDSVALTLAERGAKATAKDSSGRSALAGAAAYGSPATFDLALAKGASVEADGVSALLASATAGRLDSVTRLLGLGVPADGRGSDGITALMTAAVEGHIDIVTLLVERGAEHDPRDASGASIEDMMSLRTSILSEDIAEAESSAALIPTDALEAELEALRRNHAAILALLGR